MAKKRTYGLGRRAALDTRDHQYLMTAALPDVVPPRPTSKTWTLRWKGDQKDTPQCVGFAWHGLLRALPHLQRDPLPQAIYDQAQPLDEFPDTPPADGTSVRAGAKVLQTSGQLTAYVWAFDTETVCNWLAFHGPVVLGTTWFDDMFTPDASGLVTPTGAEAGGHAYVAIGYNDRTRRILCQNSWGPAWSIKGRFFLRYDDLTQLIQNGGEACAPTES
jgi:hypothetical protein